MFDKGDVRDRRAVALSRVAAALTAKAEGGDACEDRRVKAKDKPDAQERQRLLARAKAVAEAALDGSGARIKADIAQSRTKGAAEGRGFQAEQYAARGKQREASGDLEGALGDYRAARQLRVAGGLPWQIDHFGEDVRRLAGALSPQDAPATVESFEPDWLIAEERSSAEREAATASWYGQPWRIFPASPAEALGQPYAYVLLRDALADSEDLWKAAKKDGIDLGDRLAFAERAYTMLDAWTERRDASGLESALDDAPFIAFGLEDEGSFGLLKVAAKRRKPLLMWVKRLTKAKRLDESAVLAGPKGAPWKRLRSKFDESLPELDGLRDLFDAARSAGLNGDAIAVVLRAYLPLWANEWSSFGRPKAKWIALAEPLTALDAKRLAPALIAWTKAQQKVPNAWGLPRFTAKWLWPLYYCGAPATTAFLGEVRRGEWDNGKRLSKKQRAVRLDCLAWFEEMSGEGAAPRVTAAKKTPAKKT